MSADAAWSPDGTEIIFAADLEGRQGLYTVPTTGGAYVPLDRSHPRERVAFVLEDARVPVVVSARKLERDLGMPGVEQVWLDDPAQARLVGRESEANPAGDVSAGSLAYVIYTSGSTGRPKGVLIEHRAAVNMWHGFESVILSRAPRRPLRVSVDSSLSFDASVEQVLSVLGGHALHVAPEETRLEARAMVDYVRRHSLDVIDWVPTQMKGLLEAGLLDPTHWRPAIVVIGGESVDEGTWQTLAQAEGVEAFNTYGPTECTVNATACRITGSVDRPHIGRPLPNIRAYVLDRHQQLVPPSIPGELYLGGESVARGYLNRPELTERSFIVDPFGDEPGARIYRTGDRVRWTDGRLEFLGRIDNQVKLRGLRIELGEIEATLLAHPGVREAAVVVHGLEDARQIVGYVVARDPARLADDAALRAFLRRSLPDYMVPSALVVLESLPTMSSGKVDRAALAGRTLGDETARRALERGRPVRTAAEKRMLQIWEELLDRNDIQPSDDFFDVGGHSLLAVRLVAEIEKVFGTRLPLATLVKAPTLEGLAAQVSAGVPEGVSRLVRFNEEGGRPPVFLVTPFHGDALMFRQLAAELPVDQPVYSLQPPSILGTRCQESVESAATDLIGMISTIQPRGPYFLGGYCIGGQIALEMGCQLEARGERVAFLGLVDSVRHGRMAEDRRTAPATPPAVSRRGARSLRSLLAGGQRMAGMIPESLRKGLRRATYEICRQAGMRQPRFLQDESYLEGLVASLHRARPFGGPAVLFRNSCQRPGLPVGWGWAEVVRGGLSYVDLPGDHIAILHRPHVKSLAAGLREALERARGRSPAADVSR